MQNPLVSVIIPTFNCALYLADAVESAISQTYENVQIIVVNDGSTDDTESALRPYMDRIRYIYQDNQGLSRARNRGIAASDGELIAFLDSDDKWLPEKLERQVQYFREHPHVRLVHTDGMRWYSDSDRFEATASGRSLYVGRCYDRLFLGNNIIVSSVVLTAECILAVGVFDEDIRGVQDWDLWLRVAKRFDIGFVDAPLVHYRIHSTNMSHNQRRMEEEVLLVLEKSIRRDPSLLHSIGKGRVMNRLAEAAFNVAYCQLNEDALSEMRRSAAKSLWYWPFQLRVWALWVAALLPDDFFRSVRAAKRHYLEGPTR